MLIPKTGEYITSDGRCDYVKELEMERLSWWTQWNPKGLYKREAEVREEKRCHTCAFKMGKETTSQGI